MSLGTLARPRMASALATPQHTHVVTRAAKRLDKHQQALHDQWGPKAKSTFKCPDALERLTERGDALPDQRCRRAQCLECRRADAKGLVRALGLAKPEQLLLVTGLTGVWALDRGRVKRLRRALQRGGVTEQHWAYAIERNPRGTGAHLHAWFWGTPITAEALRAAAVAVGLGEVVGVKPVTHHGDLGYPLKNALHNETSLQAHIECNGREVLHARGFWRDTRTGEVGIKQRQAVSLARRAAVSAEARSGQEAAESRPASAGPRTVSARRCSPPPATDRPARPCPKGRSASRTAAAPARRCRTQRPASRRQPARRSCVVGGARALVRPDRTSSPPCRRRPASNLTLEPRMCQPVNPARKRRAVVQRGHSQGVVALVIPDRTRFGEQVTSVLIGGCWVSLRGLHCRLLQGCADGENVDVLWVRYAGSDRRYCEDPDAITAACTPPAQAPQVYGPEEPTRSGTSLHETARPLDASRQADIGSTGTEHDYERGTPASGAERRAALAEGAWSSVQPAGDGGCLLPQRRSVTVSRKSVRVRRLIYEKFHGPLAEDAVVRAVCLTRGCVTPGHLLAGSPQRIGAWQGSNWREREAQRRQARGAVGSQA